MSEKKDGEFWLEGQSAENEMIRAGQLLMRFFRAYSRLIEAHLDDVRADMAGTVSTLMEGITAIAATGDEKRQGASQLLVQEGDAGFVAADAAQSADAWKGILENDAGQRAEPAQQAAQAFANAMESLHVLDGRLSSLVLTMVGALSSDDVVGQRLQHVGVAVKGLYNNLDQLLPRLETDFTLNTVEATRAALCKLLLANYTMPAERNAFEAVFGSSWLKKTGT